MDFEIMRVTVLYFFFRLRYFLNFIVPIAGAEMDKGFIMKFNYQFDGNILCFQVVFSIHFQVPGMLSFSSHQR